MQIKITVLINFEFTGSAKFFWHPTKECYIIENTFIFNHRPEGSDK